jgi:hypothetical protein
MFLLVALLPYMKERERERERERDRETPSRNRVVAVKPDLEIGSNPELRVRAGFGSCRFGVTRAYVHPGFPLVQIVGPPTPCPVRHL